MFRRLLKISLLGLFLFYYSGNVMFYHSHIVDGVNVVHSHPFPLGKSGKSHSHTTCEILAIKILSQNLLLLTIGALFLALLEAPLAAYISVRQTQTYTNKTLLVKSLRAPPFSFL